MDKDQNWPIDLFSEYIIDTETFLAIILDRSGIIISCNKAVLDIIGPKPQGQYLRDWLTAGSTVIFDEILQKISAGAKAYQNIIHLSRGPASQPDSYNFKFKATQDNKIAIFAEPLTGLSNKEAEEYVIITNELCKVTRELEKSKHTEQMKAEELQRINTELKNEIINRKKAEQEREKVIKKLEDALSEVKRLSGLLPICASCKKIRDDTGYWRQIESYISSHSEAQFSHAICPECTKSLYPELYDDVYDDDLK